MELHIPDRAARADQRCRRLLARFGTPLAIAAAALSAGACSDRTNIVPRAGYRPQIRDIAVTTVPLLVKEQRQLFPFLDKAFAKGGALDGKEVYAFSPSTITVVEGDTIHFTFINPEDDVHSFVLPDFAVPLPPNRVVTATYVARHAGIYPIVCSVQSHLPMMSGQLVVLARGVVAGAQAVTPPSRE